MTAYATQVANPPAGSASELMPALQSVFARAAHAIWHGLEASGQARARRELFELAARYEAHQPGFAQELRHAAQQVADR